MRVFTGPFIRYRCAKCGHDIERQVSARNCARELDELRDGPALLCAQCWSGLDLRVAALGLGRR